MHRRGGGRLYLLRYLVVVLFGVLAGRLVQVQLIQHGTYVALADNQQQVVERLFPKRGKILVREADGALYPLAQNTNEDLLYADPGRVADASATAQALQPILGWDDAQTASLADGLRASRKAYYPIQHRLTRAQSAAVIALADAGLHLASEPWRAYTEGRATANLLGFLGFEDNQRVGRYGVEQYWEQELAGEGGYLRGLRSSGGGLIAAATNVFEPARDGSDLVLTINRPLQFTACRALEEALAKWEAASGAVVVLNPHTGAVLALCSVPAFDPDHYSEVESVAAFDNQALIPYEPGSVVKPLIMAGALDVQAVTPNTTFEDPGQVEIGGYTIKNAQEKRWGKQTMVGTLEHSINMGMVFAMRKMGKETLGWYLRAFGLGESTEVGLPGDRRGDISSLAKPGEIYAATASFGQGITATPLQLAAAYGALVNGGKLMRPYVVEEIISPDGQRTVTEPTAVRQVLTPAAASSIKAMLASVVANGPIRNAQITGYWVGGKTGTAQIPDPRGGYYEDSANHTFAGFAPAGDPAVVTIAKLETPQVAWAEGSVAPLFREVTAAALRLNRIPPDTP